MCCFKKISSLDSHFFSTIFSFLKLVCSFWQIARLQEFFINYKIGSHKHLDKLLLPPFVVLLLFHHLLLRGWGTWMDGWRDEWMKRTTTTGQTKDIIYKDDTYVYIALISLISPMSLKSSLKNPCKHKLGNSLL